MKHIFFVCVLLLPSSVFAKVVISEIAWMGTETSANDEWIELFNDGTESVSLDGWRLAADDGSPDIALFGSIGAGEFFLMERTDDETIANISADIIYTGVLSNETERLLLIDALGVTQNSVNSGEGWSLGGDNTTKDTAQRQTDGTWITGTPTPQAPNSTNSTKSAEGGEVKGTSTSKSSSTLGNSKTAASAYTKKIVAYAGEDAHVAAGAYAFLNATVLDEKGGQVSGGQFEWTFGDGGRGKGKDQQHLYRFPGTYTAVVSVSTNARTIRDSVTVAVGVSEVTIASAVLGDDGYVELKNNSAVPVDMSLWKVRAYSDDGEARGKTFSIPMTTTIAAHASAALPAHITRLVIEEGDYVELVLPSGRKSAVYEVQK